MRIEDFEDIKYEKEENGICTITFSRPERRNAVTYVSFLEIYHALEDMEKDQKAHVLILTGDPKGNAFTSGGYFTKDIFDKLKEYPDIDLMDIAQKKLCLKLWDFPKLVIAAINGLAIGGGITSVLVGADLIYMSEDAWLGFYFVKRGIIPEFANSFILPFLLGFQKAKEICFFGNKITAQEALKLGLVNAVLPPEKLIPFAREQALRLIPPQGPSIAIKLMKKTMHAYFRDILSDTLDRENKALRKCFTTHDFRESMKALKEKREPVFMGK
ncbi:MAG: enoyl-CoA hydratase/isomerase family protein [Promethearchaeota archaeon]